MTNFSKAAAAEWDSGRVDKNVWNERARVANQRDGVETSEIKRANNVSSQVRIPRIETQQ